MFSCFFGKKSKATPQSNQESSDSNKAISSLNQNEVLPSIIEGTSYQGSGFFNPSKDKKNLYSNAETDVPNGYKKMTRFCYELNSVCIAVVPEDTVLTSEELMRINFSG